MNLELGPETTTEENLDRETEPSGEQSLKRIFRNTLETIESSKGQIFEIYESTKEEVENSKKALEDLKQQAAKAIEQVDKLTRQEQQEKQKLVQVSSNFADYSEERIRACYEDVKNVQVQLGITREKEYDLRRQRHKLELRLRRLQKTLVNAERLAMRIGSVFGYLTSQISDVVSQLESVSKNKFLGVQIIKAQEEERYRVSREIHDGPAQDLANLIFQSSICERLIDVKPEEAKEGLQELRRQIRGCLTDVRQIIFDMRPMSLDDLGLVPALRQLLLKLRERGVLQASFQVDGRERTLEKHVEVSVFRILQEALNNVHRHSGVDKAKVRLLFTESHLSVLVVDEGKGFDMDEAEARRQEGEGSGHFGMLGMAERAHIIGADLSVVSAPGKGTRVHLKYAYPDLQRPQAEAEI